MPRFLLVLTLAVPLAAQNTLLDRQMALGERQAREFRKHTKPLEGTAEEYVRRVGRQLTPSGTHWQFELVKDDFGGSTREPVVFPGYIFVPARLLIMTGSEAELAGMLAHAVAHMIALAEAAPGAEVDRAAELEADRRAAAIAGAAGYNPRALIDYLRRVQTPEPAKSRVPELAARIAVIDEVASAQLPRDWKDTTSGFTVAQEFARRRAVLGPHRR